MNATLARSQIAITEMRGFRLFDTSMKVLWITVPPREVELAAFGHSRGGHQVPWITSHFPPPSQVELHVACLVPGAAAPAVLQSEAATFHLVPCPKRGRALQLFSQDANRFLPVFRVVKPDLVHAWGTEDSCGLVANRLAPRRSIIGVQGLISTYRRRVKMPLRTLLTEVTERATLKQARWIVAESRYSLDQALEISRNAKGRVIEHPIRSPFLHKQPSNGSANRVLFVGTFDARKCAIEALEAFRKVAPADWALDLVGRGSAEFERELQKACDTPALNGRVTIHRQVEAQELADLMRKSAVFLLPTRVDTGPTALKEALAMGLWPVCFDNSGPAEYVRKFGFGTLVRDLDFKVLGTELAEVLKLRPWSAVDRRLALIAETRSSFSRENVWVELLRIYSEVLAEDGQHDT
jgi:glycosyltransferase involved in cell wall biosynthesis